MTIPADGWRAVPDEEARDRRYYSGGAHFTHPDAPGWGCHPRAAPAGWDLPGGVLHMLYPLGQELAPEQLRAVPLPRWIGLSLRWVFRLTDRDLEPLVGLPGVVKLDLARCNDFDGDMTCMAGVQDEVGDDLLAALLAGAPELRELCCDHWHNLSGPGLGPLAGSGVLRRLDLRDCRKLQDGALGPIRGLATLAQLDLAFEDSVITDDCAACSDMLGPGTVDALATCPGLTDLQLGGRNRMLRDDLSPLAAVAGLRVLGWGATPGTAWEPEYVELTEDDLAGALGSVHRLPLLERLEVFAEEPFTDRALSAFRGGPSLSELQLAGAEPLTGRTFGALATAPGLRRLVLRDMYALDDEHMLQLAQHPSLEQVELVRCETVSARCHRRLAGALKDQHR